MAGVLFLLSVLWLAPTVFQRANIYDEGLILLGADRMLHGEVPYRDFWNTHAPGQISVVAAIFRLFGPSMLVVRVYDTLVRAGIAVAAFALAARVGPRAGGIVAWAAATMFLGQFSHFGYATFPALLCALTSFLPLPSDTGTRGVTRGARRRALALAGACAGCSVLFRHDLGLGATLAGIAVLWADVASGTDEADRLSARVRTRFGETLWYLVGVGATILPSVGSFIAVGTPWWRVKAIFCDYPFLVYPQVRALPVPAQLSERLVVALPAVIVLAGVLRALLGARCAGECRDRRAPLLALSLLGALAIPLAYTRLDVVHQIPIMVPAFAILPGLLAPAADSGVRRRALLLLCGAAVLVLTLRVPFVEQVASARNQFARGTVATTHGLRRAWLIPLEPSQVDAVKAVQGLTRDGDHLFVGLGRHDKALVNDALFSFLAGRPCATYYHNLLPGLVTTASVQREILADLQRSRTRLLVLYTGADAAQEPNQSRFSSGVEILDRWIRRDFAQIRVFGAYEIWERRTDRAGNGENGYNAAP